MKGFVVLKVSSSHFRLHVSSTYMGCLHSVHGPVEIGPIYGLQTAFRQVKKPMRRNELNNMHQF